MISDAVAADLMDLALREARTATEHGDVPVGAVVARGRADGGYDVVAAAGNRRAVDRDPTAHAEVVALRLAAQARNDWHLDDCILVVTLEPCAMCAGAVVAARAQGIVFGAADPLAGACGSVYNLAADPRLNHNSWVMRGVRARESGELLSEFFRERRSR